MRNYLFGASLGAFLYSTVSIHAQTMGGPAGTISGAVTANRDYALSEASGEHIPALYAVRVRATAAERHIVYTVFTNKARYQIYNLPPGTYQMSALQDGFDSSGPTVESKAGDAKTADVVLKVREDHLRAQLVDFDTLFPPGPSRDVVMNECMGCHGFEHISWQRMGGRDEETWRHAEYRMFDQAGTSGGSGVPQVNPDGVSMDKRETIIKYWASTFPAGKKQRDFKLDDLRWTKLLFRGLFTLSMNFRRLFRERLRAISALTTCGRASFLRPSM